MFEDVIQFIRSLFPSKDSIPLHEPTICGNENKYLHDCIKTGFVSSIGPYVERLEKDVCSWVNTSFAVATVNGTSALHASLLACDISKEHEVITQPLSFVATANAVSYIGASPIFIDVDRKNLGMSFSSLANFLKNKTKLSDSGECLNLESKRVIKACIPMHTFGFPAEIDKIVEICHQYNIFVIEDSAQALGSRYKNRHLGTFGDLGVYSFNGNKIITSGGGGMVVTNNPMLAKKIKHLTTTAKTTHPWKFEHDAVGYNYRMPNINAAFACAQLEKLDNFIENKRETASLYQNFFSNKKIRFFSEPDQCRSNYWINTIFLDNKEERDLFLNETHVNRILTRPVWSLLPSLSMYKNFQCENISNAEWIEERVVNLPSSVRAS